MKRTSTEPEEGGGQIPENGDLSGRGSGGQIPEKGDQTERERTPNENQTRIVCVCVCVCFCRLSYFTKWPFVLRLAAVTENIRLMPT